MQIRADYLQEIIKKLPDPDYYYADIYVVPIMEPVQVSIGNKIPTEGNGKELRFEKRPKEGSRGYCWVLDI